jgi:hypothetical protein
MAMSEPSLEAMNKLIVMLKERTGHSYDGSIKRDSVGDYWLLISPELVIQLIERAELAEKKVKARPVIGSPLAESVFDFLNDQDPDLLAEIIKEVEHD